MCLAVPGQLIEVGEANGIERSGSVIFGGVAREVNLAFVPEAQKGDWVIVHVGFALTRLNEEDAQETLKLLRQAAGDIEVYR